jgi:dienelactone hydrolase
MLRQHIIARALDCMGKAAARREAALADKKFDGYRQAVRAAVRGFYGKLPASPDTPPPVVTPVSSSEHPGFRVENVLFESFPGWQVNATVYVPADFRPPFPAVVVPVGHSGKQYESYQFPCQYFARSGFLAVCFDPPGQASEKQPGNDHFNDGVRDYLLGETSSRYFIADALRCIDYLATRQDADLSHGVAMTGVSGGGTTTTFAVQLDDRIACIGPSCCVTQLADLDITQCYNGCPETHQIRRYAEGIDEVDLLCAAAPTPCLLMAGAKDSVFHIKDTRRLADLVARMFAGAGVGERFQFFVDPGEHAYSLAQARQFTRFMVRWLCRDPERALPDLADNSFALLPYEQLRCYPRTDVNMRTLAVAAADKLAAERDRRPAAVRRAAAAIAGVTGPLAAPESVVGKPFQTWGYDWRAVLLRPEPGIELPATFLTARATSPAPTILHFDDAGRHRLLHRQGLLMNALHFFERNHPRYNLLTVDLRGWGDSAPAMYPYEMTPWGGLDRYLAYATAALGDPILAMRIRDALAALAWLRARPECQPDGIVLTGCGLGAVVALHVAAIDPPLAGVVGWESLSSFRSLLAAERYPWTADAFLPNALRYYDLPELAAALECPVRLLGLRDGTGQPAPAEELALYPTTNRLSVIPEAAPERIVECIQSLS